MVTHNSKGDLPLVVIVGRRIASAHIPSRNLYTTKLKLEEGVMISHIMILETKTRRPANQRRETLWNANKK